ncbi:5'/3'-nucleotidase SurE [Christensenellaceae bacterium OttesenSCG-928-M15]|nr:5'/3'-nucleotidase SurE [Christensenellaceae bacterium OttesenSCG-928-M15]
MNLLLCNDDGVFSAGIHALAMELLPHYNIFIAAPESQRSGAGHGITCAKPMRVRNVTLAGLEDVKTFAVDGTPADCARLGITSLGLEVDMVLSGINHGANLGSDVLYSGTVGAAMEAALLGLPAIAVSVYNHDARDFSAAARGALWAIDYVKKNPLPKGMILNLNAPELPAGDIRGIKLAPLGLQTYSSAHANFEDPFGMKYFWTPIAEKTTTFEPDEDVDERWVREGYVTLTPIHYNITHYDYMKRMDVSSFSLLPLEK